MPEVSSIRIPQLPVQHPFLLFTPGEVKRMRQNRDTYAWARHGYLMARLSAERFWRPTPQGGADGWLVPAMSASQGGRGREVIYSAFHAAMSGFIEDDEQLLDRSREMLFHALEHVCPYIWWNPTGHYVAYTADGLMPLLSDRDRTELAGLLRHALDTMRFRKGVTQSNSANKVKLGLGLVLGDDALVDEALNQPDYGMLWHLWNRGGNDGYWRETAPSYHHVGVLHLCEMRLMCRMAGIDFPEAADARLQKACPATLNMLDSAGNFPGWGDTWKRGIGGPCEYSMQRSDHTLFELGVTLYDDRRCGWAVRQSSRQTPESLAFGRAEIAEQKPDMSSCHLEHRGLLALRHGYADKFLGSDRQTAYLKYGPHGGWHDHNDCLSMELRAFGREMVADRGRSSKYASKSHYTWHRTTLAHSTVTVDRKTQAFAGPGRCVSFLKKPEISAVCAENNTLYPDVTCRRTLILVDRYLIDCFDVESSNEHLLHYVLHGGGSFESDLALSPVEHFGPGDGYDFLSDIRLANLQGPFSATLRQGSWDSGSWKPGDTGMRVRCLGRQKGTLVLAGCPAALSQITEECMLFETAGRRERFVSLLEPFRHEPAVLQARLLDAGKPAVGVEIRAAGFHDLLYYSPGKPGVYENEGVSFEGELLFLRRHDNGDVADCHAFGAGALSVDGHPWPPAGSDGNGTGGGT